MVENRTARPFCRPRGDRRFERGLLAAAFLAALSLLAVPAPVQAQASRGDALAGPVALAPDEQVRRALAEVNRVRERAGLRPVAANEDLVGVARLRVPDDLDEPLIGRPGWKIKLPPGVPELRWHAIELLAGACGGCGATASAADIRDFTEHWLATPAYRAKLLHRDATHLGFVIRATGKGRKVAVLVMGRLL